MNVIAIVLPLGAFALAILWMIKQGQEAKKEYQRRKDEEEKKARATAREDRLAKELGSYVNASKDEPTAIEKALSGSGQSAVGQKQLGHFQKPGQA
jgi:hypothetical protein